MIEENYYNSVLFEKEIYTINCPNNHRNNYRKILPIPEKLEFECKECKSKFSIEDIINEMMHQEDSKKLSNIDTSELTLIIKLEEKYNIIFDVSIYRKFKLMYLLFDIVVEQLKVNREELKGFHVDLPKGYVHLGLEFIDPWAFFFNNKDLLKEM